MTIFPAPTQTSTELLGYYLVMPFSMTSCGSTQTTNPTTITVFVVGAFKRLWISNFLINGNTRVSWELERGFSDSGPYTFQLQYSHSGNPRGDDWQNVGSSTSNFYADDSRDTLTQRMFGKTLTVHYRVLLNTPSGCYVSPIANVLGLWNKHDWLIAREIVRQEQLNHKVFSSVKGYLLKARRYGQKCTSSRDPMENEIIDSTCELCFGTGYTAGYYPPVEYYGLLDPESTREMRSVTQEGSPGTIKSVTVKGRFLATLPMIQADAWINTGSDERYYIHSIQEVANWKSVPLVYHVELRLAPFSDVLYKVPIT